VEERLHCGVCPVAPLFEGRIPSQGNQRTNNNYFNQQSHMKGKFVKTSSAKQSARLFVYHLDLLIDYLPRKPVDGNSHINVA
jgi:hypothetical protein